ncbi:Cu(+)/Ag(+) sensor histidine kinase [Burkholderia vietnamiensis]|uniref:Cu(+)/Ag(+) sensor histidine kinase n=1 Tax=Burkholderia vietnamiensis TaxID=60552 RepID=UPI0009C16572|nr:Cu(+)/Ag(+) sensor histidine kinase [Burkholderia vietnamiensis]MCA7988867.1 Cu(+)/Ag(+) sensor histidine kinase [Burkholderia vietnamiensis]
MPTRALRIRRPASLALRVTALVGIAMTLVFLTFSWLIVRALEHHFAEQDAGELRAVADAVVKPLRDPGTSTDDGVLRRRLAGAVTGHHGVFYYVADAAGTTVYAGEGPNLSSLVASERPAQAINVRELASWQEQGKFYRGAVLRVEGDPSRNVRSYTIAIAMDIDFHLAFLEEFKGMLWLATCVVLCIALLVAWLAVQWGHRPIRKVNASIRAIRSSQLNVRLNPREVPLELEELVASFNDMLARIEDGFVQLANFSADIAHELRTPVTNLTTQTEVALGQSRSAEEYREVLYSNLEEFGRMSRMIGDMLFLAQTENDPHNLHRVEMDLGETIKGLFDYFEAFAEDRNVTLRLQGRIEPINVDREMLRRALSNLLSNAIRHTPHGAAVTVQLGQEQGRTTVSVENPGSRIADEDLPRLFDRFYRVDPSRQRKSEGAGLGLAIVKSIVEAHGGEVRVASDDAVTRFDVLLPRNV